MQLSGRRRGWWRERSDAVRSLAAAGVAAGLLAQPGFGPPARAAAAPDAQSLSPLELRGITFVSSRGPATELVLEAERGRLDHDEQVADLERVRARLVGEDGRLRLELTCDRGRFDLASNDFTASGHVQGRTGEGRRFSSAWLRYRHATGLAFTDAPVLIREGDRSLRGGGLRYHVREGRLRLLDGAAVVESP